MSVMDFFRQAKTPEPMQGSQQSQEDAKKAADATAAAASEAAKKASESPLDKFSDVFTIDPKGDTNSPMFNVDPAKIAEQAKNTNFVKSIPADVLAKMEAGGAEGVKASMDVINNVAQSGYAQSSLVAAKLIEHALEKQAQHFQDVVIPQVVKQVSTQSQLAESNPALSHPAIAPVVAAVQDSLAKQHPNATPKELSQMAQDFVSAFANAVNPPKEMQQQKGKKETDWSTFLPS